MINVKIVRIHPKACIPKYMTEWASGCDVFACIDEPISIMSMERVVVPTGLIFEIPNGYELQVRSRSGLALKEGLFVLNSPGTIDSDYRGELKIILANIGKDTVTIKPGERIAQLVLKKVEKIFFDEKPDIAYLSQSKRGDGGFGSTFLESQKESCKFNTILSCSEEV